MIKVLINDISSITIRNLTKWFGSKCVLNHFSKKFERGKIYTITGPNGSGKTTLINCILGLYIGEYQGCIRYNEVPIETINMADVYQNNLGIVEQEPLLFEDTIEFNLTLGCMYSFETMLPYLELFGLDTFLYALPNGVKTVLSENANNISGGEKQKISLVRALYKNPDVLVLDEPTSALDKESSEKLVAYLTSIKKNKIILIVTHDNTFETISDEIICMTDPYKS